MEDLGRLFKRYTEKPVIVTENVKDALQYILKNRGERRVYCLGFSVSGGMIRN